MNSYNPVDHNRQTHLDAIRQGVRTVVTGFDDEYWLARDEDGEFPKEFHRAMADNGWLGITMPEEYGGSGLGVTEAAVMMHEVSSHGGGMAAASSVHVNLFGPHPIVVHGTPAQKTEWIPALVAGTDQCCFGFTEPDAGPRHRPHQDFCREGGRAVTSCAARRCGRRRPRSPTRSCC